MELLFNVGADDLDNHQWNDAINYFKEVERQHPYSEWSRRAILMEAYAHYEANDYTDAIADADRFITLYPGNASTAYAYYLKAICYFEQILDVGRDQAATEQAQTAMREVIKRYPATEYAADARIKIDMIYDQLAGKEMTVGRYYLRNGDPSPPSAASTRWSTTTRPPAIRPRRSIGWSSLPDPRPDKEANENGAVLGYNYPGDLWYDDAYKLLTSSGLRPGLRTASTRPADGCCRVPQDQERRPHPAGVRAGGCAPDAGHGRCAGANPPVQTIIPPPPTTPAEPGRPAPADQPCRAQLVGFEPTRFCGDPRRHADRPGHPRRGADREPRPGVRPGPHGAHRRDRRRQVDHPGRPGPGAWRARRTPASSGAAPPRPQATAIFAPAADHPAWAYWRKRASAAAPDEDLVLRRRSAPMAAPAPSSTTSRPASACCAIWAPADRGARPA